MRIATSVLAGVSLALALGQPTLAQSQRNSAGVDIGAVCPAGFASAGQSIASLPVVAWTDHVPAAPGFGFTTRANVNIPAGAGDLILTLTRPAANGGNTQQQFRQQITGQGLSAFAFHFESADEMVPGAWQLVAEVGSVRVYNATITVYTPAVGDALVASCQ
ncbi:DUF3859 domain-containing protein [Ketogulonicigenium robustum]|nr:DUF3859 domain-containing protein [Ketogulonicigenium robustum]